MSLFTRLFRKTAVLDYNPEPEVSAATPLQLPTNLSTPPISLPPSLLAQPPSRPTTHRLWNLFDIQGPNDCWPWTGDGSVREFPQNSVLPKDYQVHGVKTVNKCVFKAVTRSKPKGRVYRTCRDITPFACGNIAHLYDSGRHD